MCKLTELQHNIHSITKDGYDIAAFLADTMRGETPGVKVNHRMDAAKQLIKYGFTDINCDNIPPLPQGEGRGEGDEKSPSSAPSVSAPVSYLDILNYEIAHLIRHGTAEGHTIVNFLVDIMTGRDRPFTPKKFRIKPADRMAAARELLRRGFGDFGSRRKLSDTSDEANAYDTLHTDLAKRMREYSERGTDTIRFLLELMSDPDPDKEFTVHHRMYAAQELLRRGWDTNYDNIKPEHLQDYWQDKESTRLSIGQKKTLTGLPTSIDDYDNYDDTDYDDTDYEAIARQLREDEDREAASPATKLPLPQGEGWGEGSAGIQKTPSPSTGEGWDGGERSHSSKSDKDPLALSQSKSLPLSKSENEPADRKAIIKEFREAMDRGDERAALRAEAKYRRIDITTGKNIYDYGPSDPDPTVDYYFEPLNPEEQTKFDEEDRREHGLTNDEPATNGSANLPSPNGTTDSLAPIKQASALHGIPILPNPLATKHRNPTIRSP